MSYRNKKKKILFARHSPSPIPEVEQTNSATIKQIDKLSKKLETLSNLELKRKSQAFRSMIQHIFLNERIKISSNEHKQQNFIKFKRNFNTEQTKTSLITLFSVLRRIRRKFLQTACDKLKDVLFRKKIVYHDKKCIKGLIGAIQKLIKKPKIQIFQQVFIELIHNFKISQANQIEQSHYIDHNISTDFTQFQESKLKVKDNIPFDSQEHSKILRKQNQQFLESNSRMQIEKDFNIKKYQSQGSTPYKKIDSQDDIKTARMHSYSQVYEKKRRNSFFLIKTNADFFPEITNNYIKIPFEQQNTQIFQIKRGTSLNKSINKTKESIFKDQIVQDCSQCQYCKKLKQKQQMLKRIKLIYNRKL